MAVYLQFDSLARSEPFIQKDGVWVPNDNYPNTVDPPYQTNANLVQTPSNYRVFYRDMQNTNNIRTIGFLAHCKERPENLTYSVESCVVTVPASALVQTDTAGEYTSVLNEPYLYIRMMPITNSEGDLIYGNNPAIDEATFIVWRDSTQVGTDATPVVDPPRPNDLLPVTDLNTARWITYKSCMITTMRLDLQSEEWQVRIYDRYGNDIVLREPADGVVSTDPSPQPDRDLQTMLLVGIRPNYPY